MLQDDLATNDKHRGRLHSEKYCAARAFKQLSLQAAFEGRLVPQDGADEPAAKLLERIRKAKGE